MIVESPEFWFQKAGLVGQRWNDSFLEHLTIWSDSSGCYEIELGTGEVYNLYAWVNNGGPPCYVIAFCPMALIPREL